MTVEEEEHDQQVKGGDCLTLQITGDAASEMWGSDWSYPVQEGRENTGGRLVKAH